MWGIMLQLADSQRYTTGPQTAAFNLVHDEHYISLKLSCHIYVSDRSKISQTQESQQRKWYKDNANHTFFTSRRFIISKKKINLIRRNNSGIKLN